MRLLYHDSHNNLIQLKRRTQSTNEANLTSSSENLEEGESNLCEVPRDYGSSQERKESAAKSSQLRFHWSENLGESQEQSSRRRSESMKRHGWTTQEGQTTNKGKLVAEPPEPRPLRFRRSRRRRRNRSR